MQKPAKYAKLHFNFHSVPCYQFFFFLKKKKKTEKQKPSPTKKKRTKMRFGSHEPDSSILLNLKNYVPLINKHKLPAVTGFG